LDVDGELVENGPEAGALSVRVADHAIVLGLEAAAKALTYSAISGVTAGDGGGTGQARRVTVFSKP
jgi:hypothetical protein